MRWAAAAALGLLCVAGAVPAQELESDARTAGRGGLWVLGRLEDSPGMNGDLLRAVEVDAWLPWAGSGLAAASARFECSSDRYRAALRLAQLRSPVGSLTALAAAGALGCHAWQAGAAFELRELALDGTPGLWIPVLRVGGSGCVGTSLVACAAMEIAPPERAAARAAAGCALQLPGSVRLGAQVEHRLGVGASVRLGVECGTAGVGWLAGFDPNAHAVSVGFFWRGDRQRVVWGARTHPQLGWSHWWTCTFGSWVPAA